MGTVGITQKEIGKLYIYQPAMIEAAKCLLQDREGNKAVAAKQQLMEMFSDVYDYSKAGGTVKLFLNTVDDKEFWYIRSLESFKVWLIERQRNKAFGIVLDLLHEFCKKRKIDLAKLNIVIGDTKDAIYNTNMYFNNQYDKRWLNQDIIRDAIQSVDKSRVENENSILSPVFGQMPPTKLSGGVKTLMLIYNNPDRVFNASTCGDNCARWIMKFAKEKDFVINLHHVMKFNSRGFKAYIVNEDEIIHSLDELYDRVDRYCRGQQ